jgi:hypothetical protein
LPLPEETQLFSSARRTERAGRITISYLDANRVIRLIPLAEAALVEWEGVLPIRAPVYFPEQKRHPGLFWSAKAGRLLPFESRLEFAHLLIEDSDSDVVWMLTQPLRLHWRASGRARSYVPDALVRRRDGSMLLLAVTTHSRLTDPEVATRIAAGRMAARRLGWRSRIAVGSPPRVRLQNARLLASCRQPPHGYDKWGAVVLDLMRAPRTIGEIEAATGNSLLVRPAVLHLLATGALRCDLDRALRLSTVVEAVGEQP